MHVKIRNGEYCNIVQCPPYDYVREHITVNIPDISYLLSAKLNNLYFIIGIYFERGVDDDLGIYVRIYNEITDINYQIKNHTWVDYNITENKLVHDIVACIQSTQKEPVLYDQIANKYNSNLNANTYEHFLAFAYQHFNLQHLQTILLILCGI